MKQIAKTSTAAGFTLVEVLVALVITSLLVSILMGLLFYVYRVQDILRSEIVEREFQLRTRSWFSEILAGCMPAEANSTASFEGSTREISCDTLSPLRPQSILAPRRITLTLRRGKNNENELAYSQQEDNQEIAHPLIILPAGDATFLFSGVKGEEKEVWPPTKGDPETLPRRIRLIVKTPPDVIFEWLATPLADPWIEPVIKNPFGLELPR